MRKRTPQVTCNCKAYEFPHRIGGGSCSGSEWAASYIHLVKECCSGCCCLNSGESGAQGERYGSCDVVGGLESIRQCEGYQDHLLSQTDVRLPVDENTYFGLMMEEAA